MKISFFWNAIYKFITILFNAKFVLDYSIDWKLQPSDAIYMATKIWVNIGTGNGLLPDSTTSLPELVLIDHQWSPFTFDWHINSWVFFIFQNVILFADILPCKYYFCMKLVQYNEYFSHHCGYWWPGALVRGHQYQECWVYTHVFPDVCGLNSITSTDVHTQELNNFDIQGFSTLKLTKKWLPMCRRHFQSAILCKS